MRADEKLEKTIREKIKNCKTPEGYEERMQKLLSDLPERKTSLEKLYILRPVFIGLLIFMLSAVTVVAGVVFVKLGSGKLDVSDGTAAYQKIVNLKEIQENNGEVDISKRDQGITFSIENLGLDQGNLIVYYTIKADEKLVLPGERWESRQNKLKNAAIFPKIIVDRKELPTMSDFSEIYQVNDKELRGVFRQKLSMELKEKIQLEIEPQRILNIEGDWGIQLMVDRKGVKDESRRYEVRRNPVESVVFSPLGNVLEVIDGYKNRLITLRDDRGNYLYTSPDYIQEGENSYYSFFTKDRDTKYLEVIPVKECKPKGEEKQEVLLKKGQNLMFSDRTLLSIKKVIKSKEMLRIYTNVESCECREAISLEGQYLTGDMKKSDGLNYSIWTDYEKELLVFDFYDIKGTMDFRKAKGLKIRQYKVLPEEENMVKIILE